MPRRWLTLGPRTSCPVSLQRGGKEGGSGEYQPVIEPTRAVAAASEEVTPTPATLGHLLAQYAEANLLGEDMSHRSWTDRRLGVDFDRRRGDGS